MKVVGWDFVPGSSVDCLVSLKIYSKPYVLLSIADLKAL